MANHLTEIPITKLAAGFAAAVRPVLAQTAFYTDAEGLTAGEVGIGEIPAAISVRDGKFPVVFVAAKRLAEQTA